VYIKNTKQKQAWDKILTMNCSSTLFKYIFKKTLKVTFALSFILISVVWLLQSLRFINIIISNNVSIISYFSLIACLLPDLLSVIIPSCFLISCIYVYTRIKADHELHVIYAGGASPFNIALPVLSLGMLFVAMSLVVNLYVSPICFRYLHSQEKLLRSQFSLAWVKEGSFNQVKGFTTYVRERSKEGELKGVFIHSPQGTAIGEGGEEKNKNASPYTIYAESGAIEMYKKDQDSPTEEAREGVVLVLKNGFRQEFSKHTGKFSNFTFEELRYSIPFGVQTGANAMQKPSEQSIAQLLNPPSGVDSNLAKKMFVEANQRLLMPWVSLLNALIAVCFTILGSFNRRQSRKAIFLSAVTSLLLHIATIAFLSMGVNGYGFILMAYFILFSSICFFFGLLLYKSN